MSGTGENLVRLGADNRSFYVPAYKLYVKGTPLPTVGRQIFEFVLEVASGRKTKSELNGMGDEEFAPWSIGPTL